MFVVVFSWFNDRQLIVTVINGVCVNWLHTVFWRLLFHVFVLWLFSLGFIYFVLVVNYFCFLLYWCLLVWYIVFALFWCLLVVVNCFRFVWFAWLEYLLGCYCTWVGFYFGFLLRLFVNDLHGLGYFDLRACV